MKLFDPLAFLQSIVVGGIGLGITFYYVGFEQFRLKDYLFPLGIMVYLYVKNANLKPDPEDLTRRPEDGDFFLQKETRKEAPDLDGLVYVQGNMVELGSGPVVLLLWATWCGHSKKALMPLNRTKELYKSQELEVIAATKEKASDVQEFLLKLPRKIQYHVAVDTKDAISSLQKTFSLTRIPHAFIIGADKQICWHGHPTHVEAALSQILDTEED
eukprot:CAMPEP_0117873790 /NCGR_PEP_ID=MMETSP0950-20121206/11940_1 /TAXON_ID=44440 /ORGANISM="Chattonella subsalsa, Strain CCMP2191" /LENGTH=214 /DNA_ID=CAMNT_0005726925 /DNA_START=85 /DNA_END=729 /DNA_ORIENTATION=+